MARTPARRVMITMALLAGCGDSARAPVLLRVEPDRGYTDRAQRLILHGEGFLPTFTLDTMTGARQSDSSGFRGFIGVGQDQDSTRLIDFTWLGTTELSATLEPHLNAGMHLVVVVDPRDQRAQLRNGFQSLGDDTQPPKIVFERPTEDTPAGPGTRLRVKFTADDGAGHLSQVACDTGAPGDTMLHTRCPVPPGAASVTCEFDVVVPATLRAGDRFDLRAQATDTSLAAKVASEIRSLTLLPPPTVMVIAPAGGGIAGGTDVIVRGTGFLPGSRILVGDVPLLPEGGIRIDDETFAGRMPPHRMGTAKVKVDTPIGPSAEAILFTYYPAPTPLSIMPPDVPAEGGTVVDVLGTGFTKDTRIYLGSKLSTAVPLGDQLLSGTTMISGVAPAGVGRVTVWAFDPYDGWGALPDAFSWIPASDGGAPPDAEPEDAAADAEPEDAAADADPEDAAADAEPEDAAPTDAAADARPADAAADAPPEAARPS